MKLISIAQLHQSHTHTHKHQRDNTAFVKIKFPYSFLLVNLAFLLLKKVLLLWFPHTQFLHLHDGTPYLRRHWDALYFPTSSPTGLKPVAMQPDHWILTLCPLWLAGKQALVLYSETQCCSVVTGEDNGALSAKCVWLSQIANRRQRRWAGTGQAQCLHKHIRHTDRRTQTTRPVVQLAV